jgi:hypothetical protein
VLAARAQYLLFGAEIDDGCLAEINLDLKEKENITIKSLK